MNSTSSPSPSGAAPELKKKFWQGYGLGFLTAFLIPTGCFILLLAAHIAVIGCFIAYNLLKGSTE